MEISLLLLLLKIKAAGSRIGPTVAADLPDLSTSEIQLQPAIAVTAWCLLELWSLEASLYANALTVVSGLCQTAADFMPMIRLQLTLCRS